MQHVVISLIVAWLQEWRGTSTRYLVPVTCYQEGPGSARFMRTFQFRLKAQ